MRVTVGDLIGVLLSVILGYHVYCWDILFVMGHVVDVVVFCWG